MSTKQDPTKQGLDPEGLSQDATDSNAEEGQLSAEARGTQSATGTGTIKVTG